MSSTATMAEIRWLMMKAFVPTTRSTYKQFTDVCDGFRSASGIPRVWPGQVGHVMHFVANLSLEGESNSTYSLYSLVSKYFVTQVEQLAGPHQQFYCAEAFEGLEKGRSPNRPSSSHFI